jgi:hypothetical protein
MPATTFFLLARTLTRKKKVAKKNEMALRWLKF